MRAPDVKLNNGTKIPQVGLGLWKNFLPNIVNRSVQAALESGYTHFDTAQIYVNESFLARALDKAGVKREDLFITTKIWNGNQPEDKLIPSLDKSLKHLRTDYVDLLLLHFPVTETRKVAWRKMEEISKTGKAKAIGVSNYTVAHLKELLSECTVKPTVNQVEMHVYLQQPKLLEFCKAHDIVVEAYSPLAQGHGHDDETLKGIANKHSKTPAHIMLRWCIQQGTVPLPKSTHQDRIEANIDIFDFKLDDDDMNQIASLDKDHHYSWDPTDVE